MDGLLDVAYATLDSPLGPLTVFVTPRGPGNVLRGAAAAAALACERLPRHKRPKWIRAVTELPRTATGKVQRYKLREILERELGRNG